jgi:hypothetical protein
LHAGGVDDAVVFLGFPVHEIGKLWAGFGPGGGARRPGTPRFSTPDQPIPNRMRGPDSETGKDSFPALAGMGGRARQTLTSGLYNV